MIDPITKTYIQEMSWVIGGLAVMLWTFLHMTREGFSPEFALLITAATWLPVLTLAVRDALDMRFWLLQEETPND